MNGVNDSRLPGEARPMKVLLGHRCGQGELAGLRAAAPRADVRQADGREAVLEGIVDADGYVPGPWGEDVLAAGTRLRWVHFPWAGVETELLPSLLERDVTVTNCAGVFAVPMAEHVLGIMLTFARALHVCARGTAEGLWVGRGARRRVTECIGELCGATVGIVGYGGIGRAVAQRAGAFGMRVLALRRRAQPDDAADEVWGPDRLDDLLRESDYVVLSCALTPQTRGLIGRRELALMKPEAVIVNVARGAVIDQSALIRALEGGRLRGAGLDVTATEPLPADSPLWRMDGVLITPHVSGMSPATHGRQFELLRENLRRYAAGEPLLNVVDKRAGY